MPSTSSPDASPPRHPTLLTIRCCCQCGSHAINVSTVERFSTVGCRSCQAVVQLEQHPPDAPEIAMRITVISEPGEVAPSPRFSLVVPDGERSER
jgi:hypothetical protein